MFTLKFRNISKLLWVPTFGLGLPLWALPLGFADLVKVSREANQPNYVDSAVFRPAQQPCDRSSSQSWANDPKNLRTNVSLLTPGEDHRERCTAAQEAEYSGVGVFFGRGTRRDGVSGTLHGTATVLKSAELGIPEGRFVAINSHAFFDGTGNPIFPSKTDPKKPELSLYNFYNPVCRRTYRVKRAMWATTDVKRQTQKDYAFAEIEDSNGKPLCPEAKSMEINILKKEEIAQLQDKNSVSTIGMYDPRTVNVNRRPRVASAEMGTGAFRQEDMRCFYSQGNFLGTLDPPKGSVAVYDGTMDTDHNGSGGPLIFNIGNYPKWSGLHASGGGDANFGILADADMMKSLIAFVSAGRP